MSIYNDNTNNTDLLDEDDEFGGAMVDINQLRSRALAAQSSVTNVVDEVTKSEITVDINQLKGNAKTPTLNEIVGEILELPTDWDEMATDAEYFAQTDKATVPFCISLYSAGNHGEYLHPNSHPAKYQPILIDVKRKMGLLAEMQSLRVFQTPFVILDFLQDTYKIQWRPIKDLQRKRVKTIKLYFFFSFKDIQFLFAKDSDFLYYCLQFLERIRRITTKFNKPIPLPYELYLPTNL